LLTKGVAPISAKPSMTQNGTGVDGTSRFSRVKFPCMVGIFDRAEPDQCSLFRSRGVAP
jgi:hypothetical protein